LTSLVSGLLMGASNTLSTLAVSIGSLLSVSLSTATTVIGDVLTAVTNILNTVASSLGSLLGGLSGVVVPSNSFAGTTQAVDAVFGESSSDATGLVSAL